MALSLSDTTDLYLLGDMTSDARECSGQLQLACRLVRALSTPTGLFPKWKTIDLRRYSLSKVPAWQMANDATNVLKADEQVKDAVVIPSTSSNGRAVRLDITIQPEVGLFTFSMSVTDAAATLIGLQQTSS